MRPTAKNKEKKLRSIFSDFAIKTNENHPPVPHLETDADADVVALIKKLSGNSALNTVSYASEAGQFANEGFQTVICGPGSIAQAHRANEFISHAQLEKGVEMIEKLIEEVSFDSFD